MGRILMYGTIGLLALFVVASYTVLEHGNQGLGKVTTYTPDAFPLGPAYDGTEIAVNGTLVYNASLDRYELTNAEAKNPAPLRGLDDSALDPYVDAYVHVNGTYVLQGADFYIDAKTIRTLEEPPPPTLSPS